MMKGDRKVKAPAPKKKRPRPSRSHKRTTKDSDDSDEPTNNQVSLLSHSNVINVFIIILRMKH